VYIFQKMITLTIDPSIIDVYFALCQREEFRATVPFI